MKSYKNGSRARLLGSVCVAAAMFGGGASAQSVEATNVNYASLIEQLTDAFVVSSTIGSSVPGVIEIDTSAIVTDSTLLVGGAGAARNIISTNMAGNEATASLTSTVTNDIGGNGTTTGFAAVGGLAQLSDANVGIVVGQLASGVSAVAGQTTSIGISSDDVLTSSLAVLNNVQESIGVMNRADTALSSDANATDASAGIAIGQTVADGISDSTLTVTVDAVAAIDVDSLGDDAVAQSQVTLAGNTQRAIGVGNLGTNSLAVAANEIDALSSGGVTFTEAFESSVETMGANVLGSAQSVSGTDMVAEVAPNTDAFLLSVDDSVTLSALGNTSNTALANLRGNAVTNTLTIDATNALTVEEGAPEVQIAGTIASLANSQVITSADGEQTIARVLNGVRTDIGGLVTDSTVTTSTNRIEAASTGNSGANEVGVTATNLGTAAGPNASYIGGTALVDSAIGLASHQATVGDGEILATLSTLDGDGAPIDGAMIVTDIDGTIANSTVVSNANALVASATGNEITGNTITVSGTNIGTSTAQANTQESFQQVTAVVGAPGTDFVAGSPDEDFVVSGTVMGGIWEGDVSGLTTEQLAAFQAQYGTEPGYFYESANDVIYLDSSVGSGVLDISSTVPGTGGTAATPQSGGVVAQLGGALTSSTVSVDGNMTSGSATGNIATNRTTISATNLASGTSGLIAVVDPFMASADHTMANSQVAQAAMSTDVAASFAIDVDLDAYATTESDLSVSDNQQFATTRANVATNALSLSATNLSASGALLSSQDGLGGLSSTSDMDVFAPAAMSNSTLALDGNRNEAVTIVNTASNALAVDTTNLASPLLGSNASVTDTPVSVVIADYALSNLQVADGISTAEASSMIVNEEGATYGDAETAGIVGSTVSLSDNVTLAEATANQASNAMTLGSGAALGRTGAIVNDQSAGGPVEAIAQMVTVLDLALDPNGSATSLIGDSAVTMGGNIGVATARGNVATSALSVSGLDLTANGGPASGSVGDVSPVLSASNVVMNRQESLGSIAASSYSASYIDLEGGLTGGSTLDASTLSVIGNGAVADSAGNVAANSLALNGGGTVVATGLVGNDQTTAGVVSAMVTSQTGIMLNADDADALTASDTSTLTVSGNQSVAQARANVATNVLNASGLSLAEADPVPTSLSATGLGVNASVAGLHYAVLNSQSNSAGVTAVVMSAEYGASASNTGFGALNASGVGVSGNVVQASATGNSATNLVDLAALNHSGGTAGIVSSQVNSGDIMATVASAQAGSVLSGSVGSSSVGVGGNTISSSAIGNSVASTVIRN